LRKEVVVPPRANWKGYLKLSLVTCPVALFPAVSNKDKVSFHLLNGETGHRLKQQYVDSETGEIVDRENRVKGYEVGKGDYVTVSDEELAAIEIESIHTIDIESFVPKLGNVHLDKTAPRCRGARTGRRRALRVSGRAALV
jgi:DNA end-binding protein Ku